MTRARVYFKDTLAGWLEKKSEGYFFTYNIPYINQPGSLPISFNFPFRQEPFHDTVLFPFFKNLIPEGWLFDINARTLHIDANDYFGMLLATGHDCIGAVTVVAEEGLA